ncbi:MAG: type 4a pilus biogenesis protein PilO [candidate division Zixibacteria bacterium]|jgi:type IV pilus assembly protein PilO|nr:type 4a pilus biogenesis protein PilO [candidate division Zixibacteria bacterium]
MDFRDPKTQKIVIGALAFLIVVYFWYTRAYETYDSKITLKTQEFETITTNLRNVEMKAKSLDALQSEYGELLDRYHEIEALLPEVQQIPSFLVQLHTASSLTGTKITKIQPMPIAAEEFYNIASFEIEMTGTYHDFGSFVSYVANFPFIANLSRMDVVAKNIAISKAPEKEDTRTQEVGKKEETVTATFVLSTYFVRDGERLEEVVI